MRKRIAAYICKSLVGPYRRTEDYDLKVWPTQNSPGAGFIGDPVHDNPSAFMLKKAGKAESILIKASSNAKILVA